MYNDPQFLAEVRRRVLVLGESRRHVARSEGINVNTLRKILRSNGPRQYRRKKLTVEPTELAAYHSAIEQRIAESSPSKPSAVEICRWLQDTKGFAGSPQLVRRYLAARGSPFNPVWRLLAQRVQALGEVEGAALLAQAVSSAATALDVGKLGRALKASPKVSGAQPPGHGKWADLLCAVERHALPPPRSMSAAAWNDIAARLRTHESHARRVALVLLAADQGFSTREISVHLNISRNTVHRYLTLGAAGDVSGACGRKARARRCDDDMVKQALFRVLHEPPSLHEFNRTSWRLTDLKAVLAAEGKPVGLDAIRTLIKQAGFRWRKARETLTSTDPDYRDKLGRIQEILAGLDHGERFFSVDEYGPFAIRIRGGRKLVPPGTEYTVPQWQKSRGCTIVTAALELSTNQVTHFYSTAKNTAEMIRMAETLAEQYRGLKRLYLSWDAASWHQSKKLEAFREEHNATAAHRGLPTIEFAPLPASAQFLNVIESIFSGMARSIIHNSAYASLEEAKLAIDRYFADRNAHFLANPKKAGNKIWGSERTRGVFSAANNCKDPRYA